MPLRQLALLHVEALVSDARATAEFDSYNIQHNLNVGVDMQDVTTDSDTYFSANGGSIDFYNPVYGNIPTGITITDNPSTTTRQYGVYVNDTLTILDKWLLSLGLRWDGTSSKTKGSSAQTDRAITKNVGLMYKFDNGVRPYASYSESFDPVIGADIFGKTYDPQEGTQYELGVKYQPPGTDHIFTASIFDITESNRLTTDTVNPLNNVQGGEVGITGYELKHSLVMVTSIFQQAILI